MLLIGGMIENARSCVDSVRQLRSLSQRMSFIGMRADYDDGETFFHDRRDASEYDHCVKQAEQHLQHLRVYLPHLIAWAGPRGFDVEECLQCINSPDILSRLAWLGFDYYECHFSEMVDAMQFEALAQRLKLTPAATSDAELADGFYDDGDGPRLVIDGIAYRVSPAPRVSRYLKVMAARRSRRVSELLSRKVLQQLSDPRNQRTGPGGTVEKKRSWLSQLNSAANKELAKWKVPFEFRRRNSPDRYELQPHPRDTGPRSR